MITKRARFRVIGEFLIDVGAMLDIGDREFDGANMCGTGWLSTRTLYIPPDTTLQCLERICVRTVVFNNGKVVLTMPRSMFQHPVQTAVSVEKRKLIVRKTSLNS